MKSLKTMTARVAVSALLLCGASFLTAGNTDAADMSLLNSPALHQMDLGLAQPGEALAFRWPWQKDKRPPEPPRPDPRRDHHPGPGWDRRPGSGPRPEPRPEPRPQPRPQPRPGWDRGPGPDRKPDARPPVKRKDPPKPRPGDRQPPRPGDRGPGGPGPRW